MPNTLTKAPLTQTAVWGGGLARTTGLNGNWLCIPFGHMQANLSMGTNASAPAVSFNPSSTADDLGVVIWNSIHQITVLIAMVYCVDGINAAMTAKCVLEYKEQ